MIENFKSFYAQMFCNIFLLTQILTLGIGRTSIWRWTFKLGRIFISQKFCNIFPAHTNSNPGHWQDLNPEVDKPGKRKKLDATARAGSEDKDAGTEDQIVRYSKI